MHGADPSENTYQSLVDWASKIETRLKQTKARPVSTTNWLAEGNGDKTSNVSSKPQSQFRCYYCKKSNHSIQNCLRLKKAQNNQTVHSKNDSEILKRLGNLIAKNNAPESSPIQAENQPPNQNSPYKNLQADLAVLLVKYSNPQ